jgi:hypothetical protein
MDKLSPHPSRDKWPVANNGAEVSQPWNRWFEEVRTKVNLIIAPPTSAVSLSWSSINKSGSNLTSIETRNHYDLQNINSAEFAHLTQENANSLTSTADTNLHFHNADRIYARNSAIWVE